MKTYRRLSWEQKAEWEVILFDDSLNRMLIGKEMWCGIGANDTLKIFLRAYHFNQTNIVNANVSLNKVFKFGFMGGGVYSPSGYNSTSQLTDSTGYSIVSVTPVPSWDTENNIGSRIPFQDAC